MDDFLEELRGEGRPDSEGRFSVDHVRAGELLQRYRLPSASMWVLKAVQAAVALGASRVDVTAEGDRVEVRYAARGRSDRGLRHQALAVEAASGRGAVEVGVDSICVETPARSPLQRLGGPPQELRLVREACLYAAIPVVVQGKPVNRPYFGLAAGTLRSPGILDVGLLPGSAHVAELYLTSPDGGADLLPGPAQGCVVRELRLHVAGLSDEEHLDLGPPGVLPGVLMGGRPAVACHALLARTRRSWSDATFVLDGVILSSERNLMDRPGLQAVISARGLRTDLTEFALVHDDAFHRALEYLRRLALWMYD